MKFKTENDLLNFTSKIIGKKFGELDKNNLLEVNPKDKGNLGKIVETGFYGYPNNNVAEADFDNLGIELKVTGFTTSKTGLLQAKERLSLSTINYTKLIDEEFEFSKLLFKNKRLLIIWYEYIKGVAYSDFQIMHYQLYDLTKDIETIKNDFYTIKEKVMIGKAHELSEGDTSFLGANTKGKSGGVAVQPFSSILAPTRGFCLKNSYMRGVLRSMGKNPTAPQYKSVKEYVLAHLKPYIGKTQTEIWTELTGAPIDSTTKFPYQLNKMISNKLLGKDEDLPLKDELFNKTTYIIKNLPVDQNGFPCERMTFRNLMLSDFSTSWEDSEWKRYFEEITFIVICYEGNMHGQRKLKEIKQIAFNQSDLNLFKKTYEMIKYAIEVKDVKYLPYPKRFPNQAIEIGPKGKGGMKVYEEFFNKDMTRTCLMLDKEFLYKKLQDN